MQEKALKTYSLKIYSQFEIDALEYLTKNYVVQGKNLADAVSEYAVDFYNKKRLAQHKTLVTELELIKAARDLGLTVAKSSVVQYRRKGVLKDENGPWYFQNSQHKVVYDLEKTLAFLQSRAKAPKSRIIKKDAPKPQRRIIIRKAAAKQCG